MTKLIKDIFKNEKMMGKALALLTIVLLAFTINSQGTLAAFWRVVSEDDIYGTSLSDDTSFVYGYGHNGSMFGYGYGYGYGIYDNEGYFVGDEGYTGATAIAASALSSYATVDGTASEATRILLTTAVSLTPAGTSIEVILPSGLSITDADETPMNVANLTATAYTASAGQLGSGNTSIGAAQFGIGSQNLYFSTPVLITIPVPGIVPGTTVSIGALHGSSTSLSSTSLSTDSAASCSAGVASPAASTATVASDNTITLYTCAASKFFAYSSDSGTTTTTTTTTAGTGGGGSGGYIDCPNDSNTVLCAFVTTLAQMVDRARSYTRPLKLMSDLIKTNSDGTRTAQLTGVEGSILLKPSNKATISALIPGNTSVTAAAGWDGKINPPIIKANTTISKNGETVVGSETKLQRENVNVLVKAGSTTSTLTFSAPVKLTVPVTAANGTVMQVLTSDSGNTWTLAGSATVENGLVAFESKHFSFFALTSTLNVTGATPAGTVTQATTSTFKDVKNHWGKAYIEKLQGMGVVSGKSATRFAPDELVTRAELTKIAVNAFGLPVPATVTAKPFADVAIDAWFAPYVQAAKDNGIVQGVGNNRFAPNEPVTRAAALKIFIETAKFTDVVAVFQAQYMKDGWSYVFFPDVMIGQWFDKYVGYAKEKGIVGGYADGNFRPGNSITRAEAAKIAVKVLDMK